LRSAVATHGPPPLCGSFFYKKTGSSDAICIRISLSSDSEYAYAVMREVRRLRRVHRHLMFFVFSLQAAGEFEKEERLEAFVLATSHDLHAPETSERRRK